MRITELLSDGQMKNVSILDLPGFGAKLDHFEKGHQKSPTWPTEINFALHNSLKGNLSQVFLMHKILLNDWNHHMKGLYDTDPANTFTFEMGNNEVLNFTKYIKEDMKPFLWSIAGKKLLSIYISNIFLKG